MIDFWALDTEDDSKGNTKIINFYNGEHHTTFYKEKKAIEFMKSLSETTDNKIVFWATNSQYDTANIFKDSFNELEMIFAGSRLITSKIKGTQIEIWDTLNHWKISVKEMGERIGLKKLDVDGKFIDIKYCRRDTEITYKFAMSMIKHYESIGCKIKPTIGATALNFFEQSYYKFTKKPQVTRKMLDFMREGYYGGRTEIFFNQPVTGNIQYYDFNSLYPAMLLKKLPSLKSKKFTKHPDLKNEGVIECKVRCPDDIQIPYLPTKAEKTGSLIFPVGVFRGRWTYFEIREAKKLGYEILEVYEALEFYAGTGCYAEEFIRELYEKRLEAKRNKDELLADAYKLLMNNLYGKFFQGNEKTRIIPLDEKYKIREGDTIYGNVVLRQTEEEYPRHTNGIWAMYTTAYGRHALHSKMTEVVSKGGFLIYCDTDSIIFEHKQKLFKDSKELGELKLEKMLKYAHFKLPKLYKLVAQDEKKEYRTKGVPRNKAEEFFETGKTSFQRPYKIKETLRRNLSPKRKLKLKVNYWELTEKEINKVYDKRIVKKGGFTEAIKLTDGTT